MPTKRTRIAFFDVDETLITLKSMFSFLAFVLDAPDDYRRAAGRLRDLAVAGAPREETNRMYYRHYSGRIEADVAASGRRWFERELATGTLFHTEVTGELEAHRAEGTEVALVSGSFAACLAPIAAHLGVDHTLCTVPEVVDGRYTGRVLSTVIGEGKAAAARSLMTRQGASPEDCVAYGDHASDLPLLLTVGDVRTVGDDPVLREHAALRGWTRLPGAAVPEPITEGS
ncbi:HAD family hydrolase [Streptomyces jumonjinensis]|uniref:HAD family hydrolase n=1 Tax=Streptomyces jumonjinensis TaxID=1945 RepID=UPI00379C06BF